MSIWDSGVNGLKVFVFAHTFLQYLSPMLFFCAHSWVCRQTDHKFSWLSNSVAAVCHLSAQNRNVSELYFDQWFSDALAYSQIKSWRVAGFEVAVTLPVTAQCQCPKLLSGRRMMSVRAMCLSVKKKYAARLHNFCSQHTHCICSAPQADLCRVCPLAFQSAGTSPFLSLSVISTYLA